MKLEFYNSPQPAEIASVKSPEVPGFVKYVPDFELMKKIASQYEQYPNLLIVAHGGSLTSFYGFYNALIEHAKKKVYFLSTVDPDYIFELKNKLRPEDTLVVTISKSGENMTHIEMTSQFLNYPMLVVTGKGSPLREMAVKLNLTIIDHPPIGGRYTAFTEVGLLPAALAGLDVESLYKGAKTFFDLYEKDNLAWKAASVLYQLEQKGFVDVFMPFYTHKYFAMSAVIVQLCHESFGKGAVGQTYFAHEAPESQHHTNQRFFGGRKNICGFFTTSESFLHPTINSFPTEIHSVQIKGHALFDVNKIPLEKALEAEWQGTMEDARINSIPLIHMAASGFSATEVGAVLAFWQLYAVYASVLRQVDPFDQPQVENSKVVSFNKRLQYKGLV